MLLTDEELVALGAEADPVVLPFLDECDQAERELAVRVALRGLAVRGLLRSDAGATLLRPALRRVLRVRAEAPVVVCARRDVAAGDARPEYAYWHRGDGSAVEELVAGLGVHRLATCPPTDIPRRAGRWLLGPARGRGSDDAVAVTRADLVVRRRGGPRPELVSLVTGPAGTALLRTRWGLEGTRVDSADLDRQAALELVRDAIEDPLPAGRQWGGERPP